MTELIFEEKLGDTVVCDICNENFTHSKKSGGFIFAGNACCPKCAIEGMKKIEKFNEQKFIDAVCPEGKSFADFCREYRGEDASIKIYDL